MGFLGYRRSDGSCGVRNHVLVMSSVSCANAVVNAIGREVPEVKTVTHTEGCGRALDDARRARQTLIGIGQHPNVSRALIIGLGCEGIAAPGLAKAIGEPGKPVEYLVIQEQGGTVKTTALGVKIVRRMLGEAEAETRVECPWDSLIMGLECGGSDALSGITANCLVGAAADWLVAQGGTVILSETTEMTGTAHILSKRAANPAVAADVTNLIQGHQKQVVDTMGPELANLVISPGNNDGGLSNIVEKSLGCIVKGGTSTINEVIGYAARPGQKGLIIMDTPGSDIFSLTGMAAGGAQLFLFTTGRGSPAGFPIAPVIKIASNTALFEKMNDDMDINAGVLIEGSGLEEVAGELTAEIKAVADGRETKAEINRQDAFSILTTGMVL